MKTDIEVIREVGEIGRYKEASTFLVKCFRLIIELLLDIRRIVLIPYSDYYSTLALRKEMMENLNEMTANAPPIDKEGEETKKKEAT